MSATPQQSYIFPDKLETTMALLKSGQESVINASLEYLREKAKIKVCCLLYLMNNQHIYIYNNKGSQNEPYLF